MSIPCKIREGYFWKRFGVGKWHQLKSNENGATAIEFALVAGPFFFLLMTIIEVSLFFLAGQVLENAVDQVGRQLRTGQLNANISKDDLKKAIYDKAEFFFDKNELLISLQTAASFGLLPPPPGPNGGVMNQNSFRFSAPGPEIIMRLTVSYEWPLFTDYLSASLSSLDSGKALLTAMSLFRSEPYQ